LPQFLQIIFSEQIRQILFKFAHIYPPNFKVIHEATKTPNKIVIFSLFLKVTYFYHLITNQKENSSDQSYFLSLLPTKKLKRYYLEFPKVRFTSLRKKISSKPKKFVSLEKKKEKIRVFQ
jgi:hypothetical protein